MEDNHYIIHSYTIIYARTACLCIKQDSRWSARRLLIRDIKCLLLSEGSGLGSGDSTIEKFCAWVGECWLSLNHFHKRCAIISTDGFIPLLKAWLQTRQPTAANHYHIKTVCNNQVVIPIHSSYESGQGTINAHLPKHRTSLL